MIEYRRARQADIDRLVETRSRFLEEYDGEPYLAQREEIEKNMKDFMPEHMETGQLRIFLAEDAGDILATSSVSFFDVLPSASCKNGKSAYIANVYTVSGARGKGIGSRVFQMAFDEALGQGCSRIVLHASQMGEPIYRKFGFEKLNNEMVYMANDTGRND